MALEVVGPHKGYDSNGYPMHNSRVYSPPPNLPSPDHSNPHTGRFLLAISGAVFLTAATCAFPPAAGGAIVCYAAAVNEARQIPELN